LIEVNRPFDCCDPNIPVSRIWCVSETHEMELVLDVNVDIYPIELGSSQPTKFSFVLARTLNLDGTLDDGRSPLNPLE
jgi:hypothetical protein